MGRKFESVGDIPCGNTIAISGIDDCLHKTGTLVSVEIAKPAPIRPMKYSVSPVVRVCVAPKQPSNLPKLIEGLKKLSTSDPIIQWKTEETGENIIEGCG